MLSGAQIMVFADDAPASLRAKLRGGLHDETLLETGDVFLHKVVGNKCPFPGLNVDACQLFYVHSIGTLRLTLHAVVPDDAFLVFQDAFEEIGIAVQFSKFVH